MIKTKFYQNDISEDEEFYTKKMKEFRGNFKSEDLENLIFSKIGDCWEYIIVNFFKISLNVDDTKFETRVEFKGSHLRDNLSELENDYSYFNLKAESKYLKELEKIKSERQRSKYEQRSDSNTDSQKSCSDSGNSRKGKEVNIPIENAKNLSGKFLFKELRKENYRSTEIEIDGFFEAKGSNYLKLREKFYDNSNNKLIEYIKSDEVYEIYLEVGMNFTNQWRKKLTQLGKLSCLLMAMKNKYNRTNLIIQLVFDSNLREFKNSVNNFSELLSKQIAYLQQNGILLFIDYIDLPIFYALQLSSENAIMAKLETIQQENVDLKASNAELRASVDALTKENAELRVSNAELIASNAELRASVEALTKENAELRTSNAELRASVDALMKENALQKEEFTKSLNEIKESSKNEIDKINTTLAHFLKNN
jgi:hypothetical protein